MRQSPATLRRPTVSRNGKSSLCAGLLDESGHYHIRLVMSKDGGNIVPADRVRPGFEKGLDPDLFGIGGF
jgi:hypothetical protein